MRTTCILVRTLGVAALYIAASLTSAGEVECTDKPECWPEGSAMHTGLLANQKAEKLDAELQQAHKELVALFSKKVVVDGNEYLAEERLVRAIESQQELWQRFKDAECELVGALSTGASPWQSTVATQCGEELARQRLDAVREAVSCVRNTPADEVLWEREKCMRSVLPISPQSADD